MYNLRCRTLVVQALNCLARSATNSLGPTGQYIYALVVMGRSGIQFQKGLSLSEFQRLYGKEERCEAALGEVMLGA